VFHSPGDEVNIKVLLMGEKLIEHISNEKEIQGEEDNFDKMIPAVICSDFRQQH
jgi:hypothetical protein